MKHLLILFSTALFIFINASCEDSPTTRGMSHRIGTVVAGPVGQLLVVCDSTIWKGQLHAEVDSHFIQYFEPIFPDIQTFKIKQKTPDQFDAGYKQHRSILFFEIDKNYSGDKAKIDVRPDEYALDQMSIHIIGRDSTQLIASASDFKRVYNEFDHMAWKSFYNLYTERQEFEINKELGEYFGINLALPRGSKMINQRKNFFRIDFPVKTRPIEFTGTGQDKGFVVYGVFVYQYDFVDQSQLEKDALLKARDTMLKYHAPYDVPGMYMGTQYTDLVYPELYEAQNVDGSIQGKDIRGMWVFTGRPIHAPGGAFWSFHFKHPTRNKVVCVSGYLDAPATTDWTLFIREIQAVLRSTAIVE